LAVAGLALAGLTAYFVVMRKTNGRLIELIAGLFTLAAVALAVLLARPKPRYVLEDRPPAQELDFA